MSTAFDPKAAPPSVFPAHDAAGYERIMGRWSRRLAPLLIEFGGLADGDRVLDVGCGTGNLSYALPEAANVAAVTGIDQAEVFLEYARRRSADPRFTFRHADARALPFADGSFDHAFSMLVLQFIPDVEHAVAEMRRVARPDGRVTAAVWDQFGGMPVFRLLWDTAAVVDPTAERPRALFSSLTAPDEMSEMWRRIGLTEVEQTSLTIRMDYADFDDYWLPSESGSGPPGLYLAALSDAARATLREHVRRGFLCSRPDGPRSFASTAWACRGTVPS
jgi:ubiquinone/menaquinone biosynthesis C-methylase UbiE